MDNEVSYLNQLELSILVSTYKLQFKLLCGNFEQIDTNGADLKGILFYKLFFFA